MRQCQAKNKTHQKTTIEKESIAVEKKYSVEIANAITKFLKEDDWHYRFDAEDGTYRMGLGLKGDLDHVNIHVHVYDDSFTVNVVSPIKVKKDPAKRREMAEFICRANYGLKCGGFQYDIRDGEILYKVYVPCHDIVPSQEMVKHSLYIPAMMFDKYSGGMFAVLFAGTSAKDAVNACEKSSDETDEILEALEAAVENGDKDVGDLLARLSERLGITDDDGDEDDGTGSSTPAKGKRTVRVNPFSEEGGIN